jgi:hypothetical protein
VLSDAEAGIRSASFADPQLDPYHDRNIVI